MKRPALHTGRLRLDPLSAADVDAVHALLCDASVRRYLCDDLIIPREQVDGFVATSDRLFAENGAGLWCVRERDGAGAVVGLAGFFEFHDQVELLYALHPSVWGRGYACEASRAAIAYGVDMCGVSRIVASTDAPNLASVDVMRRLGMTFDREATIDGRTTIFYVLEGEAVGWDSAVYELVEEAP